MRIAPGVVAVKAIIREMKGRDRRMFLFERSEFLIPTRGTGVQRKSVRVCVRLILVLVLRRQTVYGQITVYLCLPTYT